MKLNISFLSILLACTFFSCSSDETPGVEVPERVYDATLSLTIKDNGKNIDTRADIGIDNIENKYALQVFVNKLFLAVFDAKGILVSTSEVEAMQNGDGKYESALHINEVKIPSGKLQLLLLANVTVSEKLKAINAKPEITIDDYKKLFNQLDKEKNGYLTMNSGILEYNAAAGQNYIGVSETTDGFVIDKDPIKIVRNISDVLLYSLSLKPSSNYSGRSAKFTLKKIFLANVRGSSLLVSDDYWGKVEDQDAEWWSGYTDKTGNLAASGSESKDFLCYDVINAPTDMEEYNQRFPYLNQWWDLYKKGEILGASGPVEVIPERGLSYGGGFPLGVNFYVYENMDSKYHTLLVVQGDFEYIPEGQDKVVRYTDRFYTVVINKDGVSDHFNNKGDLASSEKIDHKFIKCNNRYVIYLTVAGPGSDNPYDEKANAHVSAQVTVKNWDIVDMEEEVD